MAEKSKAKKEKIESSRVDLKESLGDIKTVVSGEREALFKVSEYKTIKLKKENENIHKTASLINTDNTLKGIKDIIVF